MKATSRTFGPNARAGYWLPLNLEAPPQSAGVSAMRSAAPSPRPAAAPAASDALETALAENRRLRAELARAGVTVPSSPRASQQRTGGTADATPQQQQQAIEQGQTEGAAWQRERLEQLSQIKSNGVDGHYTGTAKA